MTRLPVESWDVPPRPDMPANELNTVYPVTGEAWGLEDRIGGRPEPSPEPGSRATSREHDERYLMTVAESMLRAGYGHKEIERALRRMSQEASSDSGRLGIFGSLRRLLAYRGPLSRRRSTRPVSASSR